MYVRATPLGSEAVMPHVPNEALVTEGVQSFLFVEKSPGVLEKRRVTLGYCGHEESYVLAGINLGNRIVLSGALLLNAELSGN
jgi:cobalt-zinc-cadmium efflux system membrane fusion protein